MTDPRIPVTPGIPQQDNPAAPEPTAPEVTDKETEQTSTATPTEGPDKTDIPSGNEVLSGEDGIACVQDFLAHLFGPEFDNFRQQWQIKKG